MDQQKIVQVKCTLCQPPNDTILKWYGNTTHMNAHLYGKSGHNLPQPTTETELEDEEEPTDANNKKCKLGTRLDKALLAVLLTCSIAFNVLINPHFLTFIRLLNKNYRVPSPHVISNRLLDEEYAVAMSALKKELAKTHGVALTLDPWTCKAQSYPYLGM